MLVPDSQFLMFCVSDGRFIRWIMDNPDDESGSNVSFQEFGMVDIFEVVLNVL